MADLRQRKEDFVSGLTGGSIEEINAVTSVAFCAYICWNLVNATVRDGSVKYIIDFMFNWCGILLAITTYSGAPLYLNLLLLVPSLAYWFVARRTSPEMAKVKPQRSHEKPQRIEDEMTLIKRPFITAYRGSMMVITVLAILAVDFQIFPRRFAKVETWGSSLMDLGVGSFVFSNGIVSSRAILKDELSGRNTRFPNKLINALKSCGTVLVLGLLRLYFVKNLEYQEHVTEYGVHWNFFITLAFLPLVLVFIDEITRYVPRIVVAITISVASDLLMVFDERFMSFLITAPRNNLVEANREGIFSFIGYCSIFLWGQTTGFYTLGNIPTKNNLYKASAQPIIKAKEPSVWDKLTSKTPLSGLLTWSFISLSVTQMVFAWHPFDISRRFANLPYVMWVVSYNTGALSIYCLADKVFGNTSSNCQISPALEAINSNGLFLFLLANVTTGLINMAIPTIDIQPALAFLVLFLYASFVASTGLFMKRKELFIKL
ncbi:LANO_0D08416g1_1 [Lachancea nothofagi CBS 11611]|uniref:GPI-anchored wall transfer protein n=1 Tax=Lachancea nothofagi CBS 11611 TaxID=1266666 RepID=A0A1G4JIU5_9SACH|nr:LANO_0D08416g1_1 [Lachancea nothofagi CBS 11611]